MWLLGKHGPTRTACDPPPHRTDSREPVPWPPTPHRSALPPDRTQQAPRWRPPAPLSPQRLSARWCFTRAITCQVPPPTAHVAPRTSLSPCPLPTSPFRPWRPPLPSADRVLRWRPFLAPAVRRRLTATSLARAGTPARLPRLCCRCVCCVCTVASLAWFRLLLLPKVLPCGSSTCAGSICIRVELPARPEPS